MGETAYTYLVKVQRNKNELANLLAVNAKLWYFRAFEKAKALGREDLSKKLESDETLSFALAIGDAASAYFELVDKLLTYPLKNENKLEFITNPELFSPELAAMLKLMVPSEAYNYLNALAEKNASKLML